MPKLQLPSPGGGSGKSGGGGGVGGGGIGMTSSIRRSPVFGKRHRKSINNYNSHGGGGDGLYSELPDDSVGNGGGGGTGEAKPETKTPSPRGGGGRGGRGGEAFDYTHVLTPQGPNNGANGNGNGNGNGHSHHHDVEGPRSRSLSTRRRRRRDHDTSPSNREPSGVDDGRVPFQPDFDSAATATATPSLPPPPASHGSGDARGRLPPQQQLRRARSTSRTPKPLQQHQQQQQQQHQHQQRQHEVRPPSNELPSSTTSSPRPAGGAPPRGRPPANPPPHPHPQAQGGRGPPGPGPGCGDEAGGGDGGGGGESSVRRRSGSRRRDQEEARPRGGSRRRELLRPLADSSSSFSSFSSDVVPERRADGVAAGGGGGGGREAAREVRNVGAGTRRTLDGGGGFDDSIAAADTAASGVSARRRSRSLQRGGSGTTADPDEGRRRGDGSGRSVSSRGGRRSPTTAEVAAAEAAASTAASPSNSGAGGGGGVRRRRSVPRRRPRRAGGDDASSAASSRASTAQTSAYSTAQTSAYSTAHSTAHSTAQTSAYSSAAHSRSVTTAAHMSPAAASAALAAENVAARERVERARAASKPRTFQRPGHGPGVGVRWVDLASRRVFSADGDGDGDDAGGGGKGGGDNELRSLPDRLLALSPDAGGVSPSPGHARVLDRIVHQERARQLLWAPGVSREAASASSAATGPDDDDGGRGPRSSPDRDGGDSRGASGVDDSRGRGCDGGLYVPVTRADHMSSLPKAPPRLTNRRLRLPMRSDVGFPNATEDEFCLKQEEIAMEAELEESSPRLALLVTGRDVASMSSSGSGGGGTTTTNNNNQAGASGNIGPSSRLLSSLDLLSPAGGGGVDGGRGGERGDERTSSPSTSVFAPPLDSKPPRNPGGGWRPRSVSDRPPGMSYLVASPLDVRFAVGDIEPLVCSLALYYLPELAAQQQKQKRGGAASSVAAAAAASLPPRAKISEDFVFPAGDWNGTTGAADKNISASAFDIEVNYSQDNASDANRRQQSRQQGSSSKSFSDVSGGTAASTEQKWRRWKRKAIFSFDPLDIPNGARDALFLVLQISRVTHTGASVPYVSDSSRANAIPKKNKSMNRKLSRKFGIGGSSRAFNGGSSAAEEQGHERVAARGKAAAAFENFGTQFLTPLCFGVVPAFAPSDTDVGEVAVWPNGDVQEVELFAFPVRPESQDDFMARLVGLSALQRRKMQPRDANAATTVEGNRNSLHSLHSSAPLSPHGNRMNLTADEKRNEMKDLVPVAGSATLFSSFLGADFTEILYRAPSTIANPHPSSFPASSPEGKMPSRLIVDASGDCAIAADYSADQQQVNSTESSKRTKKRQATTVARLPASPKPAGYSDALDYREVLYLPASQGDDQYGSDVPVFPRRFLNLLYLYPRLVTPIQSGHMHTHRDKHNNKHSFLSVRIRLLRTVKADSETTASSSLEAIYNPSPGGRPLLKAVYTKIPHSIDSSSGKAPRGKHHHRSTSGKGESVPFRDEVKLRLPVILDGSYFLQFSLFSVRVTDDVDSNDGRVEAELLAETQIPLSSNVTKESSTQTRGATIIPNDLHKIKLGSFLLHVETRLASSIHVSDPSVATVLRDFPFVMDGGAKDNDAIAHLKRPRDKKSFVIGDSSFSMILSKASKHALVNHFHVLLFMHFNNLVNSGAPPFHFVGSNKLIDNISASSNTDDGALQSSSMAAMQENMSSLFEVVRKMKQKFRSKDDPWDGSGRKLGVFLKNFFDLFDEMIFSEECQIRKRRTLNSDQWHETSSLIGRSRGISGSGSSDGVDSSSQFTSSDHDDFQVDSLSEMVVDILEEKLLEAAVKVVAQQRQSSRGMRDGDLLLSESSGSHLDAPFSRKAYGVTSIDRMRAKAEFVEDTTRRAEFLDDDQTVITAATWHDRGKIGNSKSFVDIDSPSRNTSGRNMNTSPNTPLADDDEQLDAVIPMKNGVQKPELRRNSSDGSHSSFFSNERAKSIRDRLPNIPGLGGENSLSKRVNSVAQVFIAPCMAPPIDPVDVSSKTNRGSRKAASKVILHEHSVSKSELLGENTKTCSPGSDIEDEGDEVTAELLPRQSPNRRNNVWAHPDESKSILRGNRRQLESWQLEFSFPTLGTKGSSKARPFLYESIMVLWVQAWVDDDNSILPRNTLENEENEPRFAVGGGRYNSLQQSTLSRAFFTHMDFLLPLCLKSIALRCSENPGKSLGGEFFSGKTRIPPSLLDARHKEVLVPLVNIWARGLVELAIEESNENEIQKSGAPMTSLHSSTVLLDFFIGLLAIIHPAQISMLIASYMEGLRKFESYDGHAGKGDNSLAQDNFDQVTSSRLLRLHAIAKLSTIPCFVALNYPLKYPSIGGRSTRHIATWTHQLLDDSESILESSRICPFPDGLERLPKTHWLAELLANEGFSICASSCEAILSYSGKQKGASILSRKDLRKLQSIATDGIASVYEFLLRRHSVDSRFQTDEGRSRVSAMFARTVLDRSLQNVHWLSRMETTHKVRVFWLLCLLHILQECPEFIVREQLRIYSNPKEFHLHKLVRLLKLCNSTFQCFIGPHANLRTFSFSPLTKDMSTWIVQESFNIICAATNVLVDECSNLMLSMPAERKRLAQGVLNLLLHVMTTPQSPVTHLRAIGGASQALDKFGAGLFLDVVGDSLQHWARMLLTLMNSTALSVRSIAVDFTVSLLGGAYNEKGTIDEITLVLLTVMPEVVAREIAIYSVSDQISTMAGVECSLWPLRRALADVEDADPVDDDRVDAQLAPFLATLNRSCQAVIDGVLVELRLQRDKLNISATHLLQWQHRIPKGVDAFNGVKAYENNHQTELSTQGTEGDHTFDADEESIFEAANSFLPETAPVQRLRWLLTLKSLHESKGQWVEAAETLFLCSRTIADAIPHINSVWRPSRFLLWHDARLSLWLPNVGTDSNYPTNKNQSVMEFADSFLEPPDLLLGIVESPSLVDTDGKLYQPTVEVLCHILSKVTKDAVTNYLKEGDVESVAFLRLEELLKNVMGVVENVPAVGTRRGLIFGEEGAKVVEENAALRKMLASLNGDMTRIAERMLLLVGDSDTMDKSRDPRDGKGSGTIGKGIVHDGSHQVYVRVLLLGKKPSRFLESTALPTFLEWGSPSICRVPKTAVVQSLSPDKGARGSRSEKTLQATAEERICSAFAQPLLSALSKDLPAESIVLCNQPPASDILSNQGETKTFLVVTLVRMGVSSLSGSGVTSRARMPAGSKHFFFRSQILSPTNSLKRSNTNSSGKSVKSWTAGFVESTVAQRFPCALSRQRSIITSEFLSERTTDSHWKTLYQC